MNDIPDWEARGDWQDIRYEVAEGIAKITINRPEVRNAFRPQTIVELTKAFDMARDDLEVGAIILTGEGPLAFCSGGDQKVRGDDGYKDAARRRPAQRARPPDPDPPAAQAGGGHGGRLRHRRRPRAAPGLRPHHRRRQRPLRPDRAPGRLLRRRLRRRPAGPHRRPEEGQGDLVPVPPVRRPGRPRHGPGQHRRPARPAGGGDGGVVPGDAPAQPPGHAPAEGRRSRPTPTGWPASSSWPATPPCSTTCRRRRRRGGTPTCRSASPTSRGSRSARNDVCRPLVPGRPAPHAGRRRLAGAGRHRRGVPLRRRRVVAGPRSACCWPSPSRSA